MKTKSINFKSLKISEVGQVEEGFGQVAHDVYSADGQVEILTFFKSWCWTKNCYICIPVRVEASLRNTTREA